MPRDHRLHPRSRVRSTVRRGSRARSGSVVVHHLQDSSRPQAAVVVGKGLGGAVARHRRQRQARHALVDMWDDLPAGSLVVRILPGAADFATLSRDLRDAVGRL